MTFESIDTYDLSITNAIKSHYKDIIHNIGENQNREGLLDTPKRAAKAMQFLTQGYDMDPAEILRGAMFAESYNEMVLVKDIELYSLCEHHMLPFVGKVREQSRPNSLFLASIIHHDFLHRQLPSCEPQVLLS